MLRTAKSNAYFPIDCSALRKSSKNLSSPIPVMHAKALTQGMTFAHADLIGKVVDSNAGGDGEGEDPAA